ncbi:MAG TPA: hypothetical protein VJZ71_05940 [Phycisphaerae bacterium]|nr:hypothetical protein [Phycisphaerae bacterium]
MYQTLFERLGVTPEASDQEVKEAFDGWFARCNGDLDRIPCDVRDAHGFLANANNRACYRELLEACEHDLVLIFPREKHRSLGQLCDHTEIVAYRHPYRENTFRFRRPDQPEPKWHQGTVERPIVIRDDSSPLRRFVTFQVFRRATPLQKAGFAFLYAILIVAIIGGVEWAIKGRDNSRFAAVAVGPSPLAIEQARRRALEQSILAKHQEASKIFKSLDDRTARLRSDFKQVVGLEWELADTSGVQKPRALDLALIREQSVREAWADLIASRIPSPEIDSRRQVVEAIGQAVASGTFRAEDEDKLRKIIEWGQGREQIMQSQPLNLEHIEVMLAAEEFRLAGDKKERSSP